MFLLNFRPIQSTAFEGPGLFRFDFKECDFEQRFYTYDNSLKSIERVLDGLKTSRLLSKGAYQWYDHHFGPVIIDNIHAEDFSQIDSLKLENTLSHLVDSTIAKFYEVRYENGELDVVKHKIRTAIEFIPVDTVLFFKYDVEINKTNIGSTKVVEHNLFDYFYFIIGFNEKKFYLMTLFYE